MTNKSGLVLLAVKLLLPAGFLIILLFGYLGPIYFLAGTIIYAITFAVCLNKKILSLESLAMTIGAMLVVDMVFYSSVELFPLVDISLAIYCVLLASLLILLWLKYQTIRPKPLCFPYWRAVVFYLVTILFSGLSSIHRKEVVYFFGINFLAVAAFYAILNLLAGQKQKIQSFMSIIAGLGFISSLLAIWQLYSPSFKIFFYPYVVVRDQDILELWEVVSRVVGSWQHPSYLGIYLAIIIPISVYLLLFHSRRGVEKFFWGINIAVSTAVLLLTNTRSSVLAGFLGVILFYVYVYLPGWKFVKRLPNVRKFALLGILAATAMILYQFVFVAEIYTKPQAYRVDASATIWGRFLRADSMSTESLVQRSQLYALARKIYREHPLAGIGAKNFSYEVEKVFQKGTDTHNIFFQTAAEMGTIGLISLILLYGTVIREMLNNLIFVAKTNRKELAVLVSCVMLILFDSLFNNPLYSLRIIFIFWLLLALYQALTSKPQYE